MQFHTLSTPCVNVNFNNAIRCNYNCNGSTVNVCCSNVSIKITLLECRVKSVYNFYLQALYML